MIEAFDYYVSGVKVGRQVPRFECPLIGGDVDTFNLNHALEKGPFILIFLEGDETIPSLKLDMPIYGVSRERFEAVTPQAVPVLVDTSLAIAESFGVLNEFTGRFIPSIFGISASGACAFKLEGVKVSTLNLNALKPVLSALLP